MQANKMFRLFARGVQWFVVKPFMECSTRECAYRQRTLQLSVMQSGVRHVRMYLVEHLHQLWVRGHPRRNGITEVDQVLSR